MPAHKINTTAIFLIFSGITLNSCSQDSPDIPVKLTPERKINLVSQALNVPERFRSAMPKGATVDVPEGYRASVFYAGTLSKPRFMTWGPDSVLYIANMDSGEILALPDKNHDHIADTVIVAAKDAYGHDVKFYGNEMYVAEEKKVLKFTDNNGDGIFETRSVFIRDILKGKLRPPGGHTTRTIVFDEKQKKIYLSVGSSCNVCREEGRAVIFQYDMNGMNKKLFATGTRNCVGMTIDPKTGKLWATNNGSDNLGDDLPPEWIDEIREGGFYGYPFAYGDKIYVDFKAGWDYRSLLPLSSRDSALVKKMKAPAALVQAHSAPMAIQFSNSSFGELYGTGAFVAYRGSWNRDTPTGYKVVYLHFEKNGRISGVSDLITGFLPEGKEPWARPVGLAADKRGNLYMSSDGINEFILVLSPSE